MGFSTRLFILDQNDGLHRLPSRWFSEMLRAPSSRPVPHLAGQRVRFAEAIVELVERKAVRIVRLQCGYVTFDQHGVLDYQEFSKRAVAKFDVFLAAHLLDKDRTGSVVEAADRFTAAGGMWTPSARLDADICAAALGQRRCARL